MLTRARAKTGGIGTKFKNFPPEEVIEFVLSHSHLERADLLNARLVSRTWNQECLKIFKKSSKFRMTLRYRNTRDYIKFVSSLPIIPSNRKYQPTMPIHLVLNISEECDEDDASEDEEEWNRGPSTENEAKKKIQELIANTQKLLVLVGPESIRNLTFVHSKLYDDEFFHTLYKTLSDLSPGLEKLDLKFDSDFSLPPPESGWDKWIVLPKVKYLSFDHCTSVFRTEKTAAYKERNTIWKLIQACPNLETLDIGLSIETYNENWPAEVPFPPTGIKTLEIGTPPVPWVLEKIKTHPSLTHLEDLRFWCFHIVNLPPHKKGKKKKKDTMMTMKKEREDEYALLVGQSQEILNIFAPSLVKLKLPLFVPVIRIGCWCCGPRDPDEPKSFQVTLPVFLKLKHLSLTHSDFEDGEFRIDPASFPVIESVDITSTMSLNIEPGIESEFQFLTVKSLAMVFSDSGSKEFNEDKEKKAQDEEDDEDEDDDYDSVAHFQTIFPNVSKMSFTVLQEYCEGGLKIKKALNQLIQCQGVEKILVLELNNCIKNYLGEVLEEISTKNVATGNYLINIRKFRFVLTAEDRRTILRDGLCEEMSEEEIKAPKKLYLKTMMKSFPHLEELEVSSILFAVDASSRAKRIRKIKNKYPNLCINII